MPAADTIDCIVKQWNKEPYLNTLLEQNGWSKMIDKLDKLEENNKVILKNIPKTIIYYITIIISFYHNTSPTI